MNTFFLQIRLDFYLCSAKRGINLSRTKNRSAENFSNVATTLGATAVHMPLPLLQKMTPQEKSHFQIIGASCHSLEEAKEAQNLGCTYITAGHIFLTDCKKGLPGRGLPFLEEICKTVRIPVYAIGGISSQNMESVRKTGAAGACIMSGFMRCKTVEEIM